MHLAQVSGDKMQTHNHMWRWWILQSSGYTLQAELINPMYSGKCYGITKKQRRDFRKYGPQMWTKWKIVCLLGESSVPKLAIWKSQGLLPNPSISSFLRSKKISRRRALLLLSFLTGIWINNFSGGHYMLSNTPELH